MSSRLMMVTALATFLAASSALAAPTAQQKCQARKNVAAGKYALCRQKAEKKLVLTGDPTKYGAALANCDTKFGALWQAAEDKAADASVTCPDEPLALAQLKLVISSHTTNVAAALGGGTLFGPAARLKTGQTQCDQGDGTMGACPGSPAGQDGAVQAGLARSFTDNGDGTVTDNQTGLMWEKLSYDGTIHDWLAFSTWYAAFTKIATLNTNAFAGYTDWRLPNANEVQSLAFFGIPIDPAFDTSCIFGCTVLNCSCSSEYWSSTSSTGSTNNAFHLQPHSDDRLIGSADDKTAGAAVARAVRGGL